MKKKKIIIIVIIAVCVVAAGVIIAVLVNGSTDKSTGKAETTEQNNNQQQQENDKKNDSAQEATEKTDENRAGKYSDELFRLSLQYADEYNLDTDDFKIEKALVVQDIDSDCIYFKYRNSGKSRYACYSYDDNAFKTDSQKTLKREYGDALAIMEYGDEDVDYEVYYELTEDEIKEVNDMF